MWLKEGQDNAFDPFHDLIEELEKKFHDLGNKPGYEQEVFTVSRGSSADMHKITIEWSNRDRAQLFLLQIRGLDFSLSANLGELTEVQASFTWGYLASQLPEVFFSGFTTPFDLKIMDHTCDPPRPIFDFGGAGSVSLLSGKNVFAEISRGHWAHLLGLRHRAALDMTKLTALNLVITTWFGFVQAIRENALLQEKFSRFHF